MASKVAAGIGASFSSHAASETDGKERQLHHLLRVNGPELYARPLASRVLFSMKYHQLIVGIQMPTIRDKAITCRYLRGLHGDLSILEKHLKEWDLGLSNLDELLRADAIESDLKAMKAGNEEANLRDEYNHAEYLESIGDKPHRLLAHIGVHYGGFLSGGQQIAPILRGAFGQNATHLYQYKSNSDALFKQMNDEIHNYLLGCTDVEFEEFKAEVRVAWEFICDLFDRDVRDMNQSRGAAQSIWGQASSCFQYCCPTLFGRALRKKL